MAHVGDLAANAGEAAHALSLSDPEAFWRDAAALIDWVTPPQQILDDSAAPLYRWYVGGQLNTCANALDRHVAAGRGDRVALIHDSAYTGDVTTLTYAELLDRVSRSVDAAGPQHPVLGPWVQLKGKTDEEIAPAILALQASWGETPDPAIVNPLVVAELRSPAPTTLRSVAEAYARLAARVAPEWAGGPAQGADEGGDLVALRAALGGFAGVPIAVSRVLARRAVDLDAMGGQDLVDTAEDGVWRRHETASQEECGCIWVHFRGWHRKRAQRLERAAEDDGPSVGAEMTPVERP
jgi:hypothetical protein